MNFHRLFEETIFDFDVARLAKRQEQALEGSGLAGLVAERAKSRTV
jgi:hypothetical protein